MRLFHCGTQTELEVDLMNCEQGVTWCTPAAPCRIHALYGFLRTAGHIAPRTSLDDRPPEPPALPPIWCWRREPGETLWADTNSMVNHSRVEVEHGALWLLDTCSWCAEGNPRVRSSVVDCYVHIDTPVGRKVCAAWKVGGRFGTGWYLTGDPRQVPGIFADHCFWCSGTGRVAFPEWGGDGPGQSTPCPRCGGTGHLPDPPASFPRECEFGRID